MWQKCLISCLIKIIFRHIRRDLIINIELNILWCKLVCVLYKQVIIRRSTHLYIWISYSPPFTETKHDDGKDDCNYKDDNEWQDQYQQKVTSKVPCRRVIHWCSISWFMKSFSTECWFGVITDNQSCFTLVHLQTKSRKWHEKKLVWGSPINVLQSYVPLWRVWFSSSLVWDGK